MRNDFYFVFDTPDIEEHVPLTIAFNGEISFMIIEETRKMISKQAIGNCFLQINAYAARS